jgi:murein DD-endopeptidase MepM/ murein hydrolase activator NlpD
MTCLMKLFCYHAFLFKHISADDYILMQETEPKSKLAILTQNVMVRLRKLTLPWLILVFILPIYAVYAAFDSAPAIEAAPVKTQTVIEALTLPPSSLATNSAEAFWQLDYVRHDDTLASLFKRMSVRDEDAIKFLMLAPEARAINTALMPGHSMEIKTNAAGKLLHLEYELDEENILIAGLTRDGYQIATQKLLLDYQPVYKSATIRDSLFSATDDAGIPDQIALQIAEIFSGEIDFHDDLRPNDYFNVVYEAFYNAGELMKTGNVLAVEFVNNGKVYKAIHFGEAKGKYAYYTIDGKSLHKSFLRSPLEFTRVSSTFSRGRYHPILQRMRAHQGVDFAAPMGTRVKAAGDGVVAFMGVKGGYGNVVIIKHDNGISTVYGHLMRFASDLRKGAKVEQSDIIGYVGMTGLATGPHLHYEFLVDKVHRDPLTVALPTSIPIEAQYKKAFDAQSLERQAQLEMLNRRRVAQN